MTVIIIIAVVFLIIYVLCRVTCGRCKSKTCLLGKTAIVTGGNSGIGYEVALDLACRGCRVIIADKEDSTKSRNNIITETSNPNVISKHLDLASFKSIRAFAEDINNTEERLDILVNNAGTGASPTVFTEDGIQVTWQVNHYGPFLLTHLLIDLLKKSAPSRIVSTSSILGYLTLMKEKDMEISKDFDDNALIPLCYRNSKLCVAICAKLFADKLRGTNVTSNVLHPGLVATSIFSNSYKTDRRIRIWLGYIYTKMIGKTAEEGAQTTIHLATANQVRFLTGAMFWDCKRFWMPLQVDNKELSQKVWKKSEDMVHLKQSEKLKPLES